jgi:C4-type Zn-finger protein
MPLCVYLCLTPGCQTKIDRWMPSAAEGADARIPCPRCGQLVTCAWQGQQTQTPNLRDISTVTFHPKR